MKFFISEKNFVHLRSIYIQNIYDGKWNFFGSAGCPNKSVSFLQ